MKPFQTIIFSALITTAYFWLFPGQLGNVAARSPNSQPPAHPSSTVVSPPRTAVKSSPATAESASPQPFGLSLIMPIAGLTALLFWIFRKEFGIDRDGSTDDSPYGVLRTLIREVDESSAATRHEARSKAKAWLLANVNSLGQNEIYLAKAHLSYLLPPNWGS